MFHNRFQPLVEKTRQILESLKTPTFEKIYDNLTGNSDKQAKSDFTIDQFIKALDIAASDPNNTVRDAGFGHGIFDPSQKGGQFFINMSPHQIQDAFDISINGAKLELKKFEMADDLHKEWKTTVGFSDVIYWLITDGSYNLRPQFNRISKEDKKYFQNQLEEVATLYFNAGENLNYSEKVTDAFTEIGITLTGLCSAITEGKIRDEFLPEELEDI